MTKFLPETQEGADAPSRVEAKSPCPPAPDRTELRQLRNDPARPLARGHALDIVEAVAEARRPVLPRRPRGVWRERDIGQGEERMVRLRGLLHEHVEAGARDLLLGQ